ncbi:uncharacterized protein LOC134539327 [Bacillus rossius redtenbacheri]|uniref:uncharacterized protein LOC134539327 n=1 Tax=Bacillus rossius redtenbacheri TaxID=93214 RepID=UPI002FDD7DAD
MSTVQRNNSTEIQMKGINVPLPSEDEAEMSSDDGFITVSSKKVKRGENRDRLRPPLTNPAIARQHAERARKQPRRQGGASASQPAASANTGTIPAPQNPAPQAKKVQIKPLFVFVDQGHSYPVIKAALDAALHMTWTCVSRGHDQLMIHTATIEDYHRAVQALEQAGVQHSVLLQPDEIPNKFVFCRVHSSIDKEFIQAEFVKMGLPVQNFWFLCNRQTRRPINKLVVELPKAVNSDRIYAIKTFCNLSIRVEDYRHPKGPMQCGNCQRFGHPTKGCRASPVCRWCSKGHKTENCPEGGDRNKAKCASCKGPHCANYRGCQAYKRENWRYLPQEERKERELQSKRAIRENKRAAAAAQTHFQSQQAGSSSYQPQPPRQVWRGPSCPAPQQWQSPNQYSVLDDRYELEYPVVANSWRPRGQPQPQRAPKKHHSGHKNGKGKRAPEEQPAPRQVQPAPQHPAPPPPIAPRTKPIPVAPRVNHEHEDTGMQIESAPAVLPTAPLQPSSTRKPGPDPKAFLKVVGQSKTFIEDPNLSQALEPMCQLMAIWCDAAMSLEEKIQATMGFVQTLAASFNAAHP